MDTPAAYGAFHARLKLAQGDVNGALTSLGQTEQLIRRHRFEHWLNEVTAVHIQILLHQGKIETTAELVSKFNLPISQSCVLLAQDNPAALTVLEPVHRQAKEKGWAVIQLQVMLLAALGHHALGEMESAVRILEQAVDLATPGGLIRLFVDEGPSMAALLGQALKQGITATHILQLQAAFAKQVGETAAFQLLADPLTDHELEVLRLLTTDLTGPEIANELMVPLNTMRTYTKNIYSKLGVSNRRAAVRRSEEIDLI